MAQDPTNRTLNSGDNSGSTIITSGTATPWLPSRPIATPIDINLINSVATLQNQNNLLREQVPLTTVPPTNKPPVGLPKNLLFLSATQEPSKQQTRVFSQVIVTFERAFADPNFAGVRIWFEGYLANPNPVLMASGLTSPIIFLCEATGETVKVLGQLVAQSGIVQDLTKTASCFVTLNGQTQAPPPPTITQTLTGTALGYQFAFLQVPAIVDDVIDGYKVYRNTSGILDGTQTVIQYILHNPQSTSSVVFTDTITTSGGVFDYYWVSSVDVGKLESVLAPAQSGPVSGSIGSVPASLNTPFRTAWTTTSATITTSPSAFFTRADGTKVIVGSTTTVISTLTPNNTLYFLPYWRETDQTLQFVNSIDILVPFITTPRFTKASSQWVQTTTQAAIPTSFSFEMWINSSTAASQALMCYATPQGSGAITFETMQAWVTSAGEINFTIFNGATWQTCATSGASVLDGSTHHITCAYDPAATGGTLYIWVDSKNTNDGITFWTHTGSGTVAASLGYWHMGFVMASPGSPNTANLFCDLSLSHVAIYNSVFIQAQVDAHFQAFVNLSETFFNQEVTFDSATTYWKLIEPSGTTAADSVGSNTGTYINAPTLHSSFPVIGVQGSPNIAWPYLSLTSVQAQYLRNHTPLGTVVITTSGTGSGSSGGSGGGGGVGGGGGGCFSGNTRVETQLGRMPISMVRAGDLCLTAKGTWCKVLAIEYHEAEPMTLHHMGMDEYVTPRHKILHNSKWVRACELFPITKECNEPVYSLSMESSEPIELSLAPDTERSFLLANGYMVTNTKLNKL